MPKQAGPITPELQARAARLHQRSIVIDGMCLDHISGRCEDDGGPVRLSPAFRPGQETR
jgi:hypothetical protein